MLALRYIQSPEGHLIDPETGEVIEDQPIADEPEYRAYDYEEWAQRAHYIAQRKPRPRRSERISYELEKGAALTGDDYRYALRHIGLQGLGEAEVIEVGGIPALIVYRCLRRLGYGPEVSMRALRAAWGLSSSRSTATFTAASLRSTVLEAYTESPARWVSKPSRAIDVPAAARMLHGRLKRGAVPQVHATVSGVEVQVTRNKIDLSAKLSEEERVIDAAVKIEEILAVKLSRPEVRVVTITMRFPFNVSLAAFIKHGVEQRGRVKMSVYVNGVRRATVLLYRRSAVLYINVPRGARPETLLNAVMLEFIPQVCSAALL
ncbi:MAG TPA: hypothetical protein EYP33_00930 [Pyrodictium sp.]|nr:hypothetical protein [Pyrodictium sp.]